MASVKRFRNSRIWYACYRSPDGKRRQRSTGTEDRDEALAIAIAYERTAKAAVRREFTQQAAARFLAEIAAITGTALPHSEPVKDMLTRWLAARRGSLAKRSFETYEQAVRELIAHGAGVDYLSNQQAGNHLSQAFAVCFGEPLRLALDF